jgi:hypothetical protein
MKKCPYCGRETARNILVDQEYIKTPDEGNPKGTTRNIYLCGCGEMYRTGDKDQVMAVDDYFDRPGQYGDMR